MGNHIHASKLFATNSNANTSMTPFSFSSSSLSPVLLGAIVADCATMPLHWIYDTDTLQSSITNSDIEKCEFNSVASCPFYSTKEFPGHYNVGQPSPYGEQLVAMYRIVNDCAKDPTQRDNGDSYAMGFKTWLASYSGRKDSVGKAFEEKIDAGQKYPDVGIDDDQAMSLYKAVVAFETETKLEPLVRFLQNNDMGFASAEFLLVFLKALKHDEKATLKEVFVSIIEEASPLLKDHLKFLEENLNCSTNDFLTLWSNKFRPGASAYIPVSCHNPQALLRSLHVSIRAQSYEDGIRKNLLVGGDNASTAIAVGALLASRYNVPKDWVEKIQL